MPQDHRYMGLQPDPGPVRPSTTGASPHQHDLATIWRGGCIIRAKFLNRIKEAGRRPARVGHLLAAPYFRSAVESAIDS